MQRRVLILGATGQLGHDLLHALASDFSVTGVGHETDIASRPKIIKLFSETKPDIVINAAAYNKVEDAEGDPLKAYEVNAIGPFCLATTAKKHHIPILHLSTDYVFDGRGADGFCETDPAHPCNVYGASKVAGEHLTRIANSAHWIIRTSALFGINIARGKGYNFVTRMLATAKENGVVRVVADQWTTPTYTRDVADGIKNILNRSIPYGTYHLVNKGSTTWEGFAKEIFRLTNISVKVEAISTEESGTKIVRPRHSILRNEKLKAFGIELPPWEDGLKRYLEEIKSI